MHLFKKLKSWYANMENWKYGIFYSNKEDERLWVPKKQKWLGWTLNMSKPIAKWIVFAIGIGILSVLFGVSLCV